MKDLNYKPVRLNIQLTKRCNQRCISCNSYKMDWKDELSTKEIIKLIYDICEVFPIKNIAFTGGEPTIHKDFIQIAKEASNCSEKVSVTTNGYYCSSKEKLHQMIEAGVNRFSFSYHGIGTHDTFIRLGGGEKRLRNAIQWLREEKEINSKLYVKIGMLFDGKNIGELEKMLEYAEESKLDGLYIEILDKSIPIFENSELIQENKFSQMELISSLEVIKDWIKRKRPVLIDENGIKFIKKYMLEEKLNGICPLGFTDIYIESNGNVRSGCWVLPVIGNIREESIRDLFKSEVYQKNLLAMKERKCPGCTCGYLMQSKYLKNL